jgi:CHASE3 domain sensor protein
MAIMQKELTAIQETNKHIASNQQMTTDHLLKRLHYLTVLVGILAVIGLAGILF